LKLDGQSIAVNETRAAQSGTFRRQKKHSLPARDKNEGVIWNNRQSNGSPEMAGVRIFPHFTASNQMKLALRKTAIGAARKRNGLAELDEAADR